jgi:glycine/D-amino acid oxidase-like deaminating enzyme
VVLVERAGVACGASGKSGGFLALDWCDGSPLGALARRSFALHAELDRALGGGWGYRRLDTLSLVASARRDLGGWPGSRVAEWLGERAQLQGRIGTRETTAQVHPRRFTERMVAEAVKLGARLLHGRVEGVVPTPAGERLRGVRVDGRLVEADAVVLALGPWSLEAVTGLRLPPVHGLKGNSILLKTDPALLEEAIFADVEDRTGHVHSPEIFPRDDGTTYVCGLSSNAPVPDDPATVAPEEGAGERLRALVGQVAPALGTAEILAVNACFRPVTSDGLPLIGQVPGLRDAWVATGHSVWGMLNAPATGEAIAGLVLEGRSPVVDLAAFDPSRLPPERQAASRR